MDLLLTFVLRNAFWIVLICLLAVGWQMLRFLGSGRQRRTSSFGLERAQLARERNGAIRSIIGLTAIIVGVTWMYLNVDVPTLQRANGSIVDGVESDEGGLEVEPARLIATRASLPTATPLIAPTATLGGGEAGGGGSEPAVLQVTPVIEGCDDNAVINQPASGSTVSGGVSIFGRATADDFSKYILEIRGAQTQDEWRLLIEETEAVDNGFLGTGELFNWLDGVYQIRLTIFDSGGGAISECLIQIGVES